MVNFGLSSYNYKFKADYFSTYKKLKLRKSGIIGLSLTW
jgi:hypothetical protein